MGLNSHRGVKLSSDRSLKRVLTSSSLAIELTINKPKKTNMHLFFQAMVILKWTHKLFFFRYINLKQKQNFKYSFLLSILFCAFIDVAPAVWNILWKLKVTFHSFSDKRIKSNVHSITIERTHKLCLTLTLLN